MYIWNKVLVGLTLLVSVAFFFFALRALKTHKAWQESYQKHQVALENTAKQRADLSRELSELKVAVHKYTVARGRVWPNSQAQQFDPATGSVTVQLVMPPPANAVNHQLYVFEEPSQNSPAGQYLGEFTVKAVDAQGRMQLQTTRALTDDRRTRIAQPKARWSLYEAMPKYVEEPGEAKPAEAAPGTVAGDPNQPAPAPAEASPSDAAPKPQPVAKPQTKYLADYESFFNDCYRRRVELEDMRASIQEDINSLNKANTQATERIDLLNKQIAALKTDKSKAEGARDAVGEHLKAVQGKIAELQSAIDQTKKANRAAVAEIARLQVEATRRIDERTRKMAQAGVAP